MTPFRWPTIIAACLLSIAVTSARAETRVALVVGNGAYKHTTTLRNAVDDASAIGAKLRGLGFNVVEGQDLTRAAFQDKLRAFAALLQRADTAVMFYAGHGLQVNEENWLLPVDSKIESELELELSAIPLAAILKNMSSAANVRLVFIDACRDNPMAVQLAQNMGTRSGAIGRGLARVDAGLGTLIAYSAQPGAVARDGRGSHSPFAGALLEVIDTPQLEVRQMLTRVRVKVVEQTDGEQRPWDHSSLMGDFYFVPGGSGTAAESQVAVNVPKAVEPAPSSDPSSPVPAQTQRPNFWLDLPDAPHYVKLKDLFRANESKAVIDTATSELKANPDDGWLYLIRGVTYMGLSICESALPDLRRAKRAKLTRDGKWSAHTGLVFCDEDVIDEASAAIALYPDSPDMYVMRSLAYAERNNYRKALADANRAVLMAPTDPNSFAVRGFVRCMDGDKLGSLDIAHARNMLAANDSMGSEVIALYAESCE